MYIEELIQLKINMMRERQARLNTYYSGGIVADNSPFKKLFDTSGGFKNMGTTVDFPDVAYDSSYTWGSITQPKYYQHQKFALQIPLYGVEDIDEIMYSLSKALHSLNDQLGTPIKKITQWRHQFTGGDQFGFGYLRVDLAVAY